MSPSLACASGVRNLLLIPRISDTLRLSSPASHIVPYLALAFALLFITHGLPTLKRTRCDSCTSGMDICTFRSDCCIFTLESHFSGRSASSLPKGDNVKGWVSIYRTYTTSNQDTCNFRGKDGRMWSRSCIRQLCLHVSIRRGACCYTGMHSFIDPSSWMFFLFGPLKVRRRHLHIIRCTLSSDHIRP